MQILPGLVNRKASLGILLCLSLSACGENGFDREYRLRFWEKCRIGAVQAVKKRQYKTARTLAEEAISQAQGFGESDFRLGVSYTVLGDVCKEQKQFQESENAYKKAIKILESAEDFYSKQENAKMKDGQKGEMADFDLLRKLTREDLANALSHLADLYASNEDFEQASNTFSKAATIYQSIVSGDKFNIEDSQLGQELVYSLLGLAESSIQTKNLDAAAEAYNRSLQYAAASHCTEFLLVEIRDGYLNVLKQMGRTEEAQKLICDANCTKLLSDGNAAFKAEDYASAESLYKQAFTNAQNSIFEDRRVMHCLACLANAQLKLEKLDDAERTCIIAERYMTQKHMPYDRDYDTVLTAYVNVMLTKKQSSQALAILSKQHHYRFLEFGPSSIQACETLALAAKALLLSNNKAGAEQRALQLYKILKLKHMTNKRAFAAILETAHLLGELGHRDLDIELEQAVTAQQLKRMDPHDPRYVAYQATLFTTYMKYGNHDEAYKLAQETVDVLKLAPEEQRVAAYKYLVLMLSCSNANHWYDISEIVAKEGQIIFHNDFKDQYPDDITRMNWPKDIGILEKQFGRKF